MFKNEVVSKLNALKITIGNSYNEVFLAKFYLNIGYSLMVCKYLIIKTLYSIILSRGKKIPNIILMEVNYYGYFV